MSMFRNRMSLPIFLCLRHPTIVQTPLYWLIHSKHRPAVRISVAYELVLIALDLRVDFENCNRSFHYLIFYDNLES